MHGIIIPRTGIYFFRDSCVFFIVAMYCVYVDGGYDCSRYIYTGMCLLRVACACLSLGLCQT